jgi:hypothetical protein
VPPFRHEFAFLAQGWNKALSTLIGGMASGLAFGRKLKGIAHELAERNRL